MGIIEAIKKIEREEAFEKGIKKGRMEGIKKGMEEGKSLIVINLLNAGKFTTPEIANFANVSESFVRKIKRQKV